MDRDLYRDAMTITDAGIKAVLPDQAVKKALADLPEFDGKLILVACGKAAWQMAAAACDELKDKAPSAGIVITKYDHVKHPLPGISCYEAGHPVPDENGFSATAKAIELVSDLSEDDLVLFLLSGGGSALFEKPLISGSELQDITNALLAGGADITEMNTIRKHLSAVKGGRFAEIISPARVYTIVLSDILGDPLDMIASGPAFPDSTTSEDAMRTAEKYKLTLSDEAVKNLNIETPKHLVNVETTITGSVRELCAAVSDECVSLGYTPYILTDHLDCEARAAGRDLGRIAAAVSQGNPVPQDTVFDTEALAGSIGKNSSSNKIALIAGGETIVYLTGSGMGGRNQELALAAAPEIDAISGIAVFSVGSDGTDGPTDAAGGYVDSDTVATLNAQGITIESVLADNDAYHALQASDGLIVTGPTGTNVNDVSVALITECC